MKDKGKPWEKTEPKMEETWHEPPIFPGPLSPFGQRLTTFASAPKKIVALTAFTDVHGQATDTDALLHQHTKQEHGCLLREAPLLEQTAQELSQPAPQVPLIGQQTQGNGGLILAASSGGGGHQPRVAGSTLYLQSATLKRVGGVRCCFGSSLNLTVAAEVLGRTWSVVTGFRCQM
jgi:hypothetical protein